MDDQQSLGQYLKARRQQQQLSLADIASLTRVKLQYLQALEEDRYDLLPAETYLKGFLANYATALQLPVEEVLNLYRQSRTQPSAATPIPPQEPLDIALGSDRTAILKPILLLCVLVILAAGGWWLLQPAAEPELGEPVEPPAQSEVSTQQIPVPAAGQPAEPEPAVNQSPQSSRPVQVSPGEPVKPALAVDPVPQPASRPVLPQMAESAEPAPQSQLQTAATPLLDQPLVLEIKALQPVSLSVTVDSRPDRQYALQSDSVLRWRVRRQVRLQADPPQAVQARLGGKEIRFDAEGRYRFPTAE